MEQPSLDELRSANDEMKRLLHAVLDGLDQQAANLTGVCERLAASRSSGRSADRLVEVIVDSYGIVVEVRLADDAYRTASPERLARSITEAARAAAVSAQRTRAEITASVTEISGGLPDLPDLFPGAPSLREIHDLIDTVARVPETTDSTDDTGHGR